MMRQFHTLGASIVLVKEIDSAGSVTVNDHGRAVVSYDLGRRDREYLRQGLAVAAAIHLAAGAKKAMTLHTQRTEFTDPSMVDRVLADAHFGMNDLTLFSAHPLGTCRMGRDPRRSVVDSHCQAHDVKGLFVIDGSVTPTSLGVNPQVTILAIAEKNAEWIASNFSSLTS